MTELSGRTAIVTGGGSGIGRSEALALGREGAHVVVNDLAGPDASGTRPADRVVAEVRACGGSAEANYADVADWEAGAELMDQATSRTGQLDALILNAGFVRDRTLAKMTGAEWDDVVRVHMRGHFILMRHAAAHWKERSAQAGQPVYGRIVATSSEAGLFGHAGQINYSAAKGGIAMMTIVAARELGRYGVRANAICPRARTAMTIGVVPDIEPVPGRIDDWDPDNIAPLVSYLAGPHADVLNGQIFVVFGGTVRRMALWSRAGEITSDVPWTQQTLAQRLPELAASSPFELPSHDALTG